jgi:MoaA/NifB/PqqE/SkfB family radical SAM enzyme
MDTRMLPEMMLDGTKLGLYRDRVDAWKRGERIAPITVDMALTRACNLSCIYCYGQLQENERYQITVEVISRTMRDFAEIGVKGVSLVSDGESTCSPNLVHAVFEAHNNGLACALGTNGVLLSRIKIEQLTSFLSYLRFNVSAGTKEGYHRIMRPKDPLAYEKLIENIRFAVEYKNKYNLSCTIGMQMVLMPEFKDEIIPLTRLATDLGVDYLVIKHCSDDEKGSLGVDYAKYAGLEDTLRLAESMSRGQTRIIVKWSKIKEGNVRSYRQCFGPPFLLQISGSGLVAPCGMLFSESYRDYHIGNIVTQSFKEIWKSERYWEVMRKLASPQFNAQTMCGFLCLQHSVCKALDSGVIPEVNPNVIHKEFV